MLQIDLILQMLQTPRDWFIISLEGIGMTVLNAIAEERGETLARMALKWVMRDGAVTSVLVGASHPEQLIENCRAFEGSPLGEEELVRIDAATAGL